MLLVRVLILVLSERRLSVAAVMFLQCRQQKSEWRTVRRIPFHCSSQLALSGEKIGQFENSERDLRFLPTFSKRHEAGASFLRTAKRGD